MDECAGSHLLLGRFEERAVVAAAESARAACGGQPTCGFLFVSADWLPQIAEVLDLVRLHGRAPLLAGAVGSGLIGTEKEVEAASGMSLLLVRLPRAVFTPLLISADQIEAADGAEYWRSLAGAAGDGVESWIVLANPFAPNLEKFLREWSDAFPHAPCLGGLASGGRSPEEHALLLDGGASDAAVLALAVKGHRIRTIVSQGCKPVGEPFTITRAEEHLVVTLGSRPAYAVLRETFDALSDEEKNRARGNLFAGLAASEYVDDLKRGDFLIRNLLGADPNTGAVAVGAHLRTGQTLQYQLRDKITADADLRELAQHERDAGVSPLAALVFSCNGRGQRFFEVPNHDAAILARIFGPVPSAGFFCNGEIGPVAGATHLHGYTASIALF